MRARVLLLLLVAPQLPQSASAASHPVRARQGMVVSQDGSRLTGRRRGDARRRQRGRRRGGDGLRAGGDASRGRQHRRRRLHARIGRPAARPWPTTSARRRPPAAIAHDVPEGREVRRRRCTTTATCRSACRGPWRACTWRGRSTARCRGGGWSSRPSRWRATASSVTDGLARSLAAVLPDDAGRTRPPSPSSRSTAIPYAAGDVLQAAGPRAHARANRATRARPASTKARPRR